ncbi:hypothetical protein TUM3792_45520 [Shewanella sp. MBTL60-007]|nr:hypothetical protein TUM3792_45520 [Shewanella sp. MBTL60-007]
MVNCTSQRYSTRFFRSRYCFGEESLKNLIAAYEKQGGEVWDKLFEQAVERAAAAPLAYGYFALETQDEIHLSSAKLQLGVE